LEIGFPVFIKDDYLALNDRILFNRFQSLKYLGICFVEGEAVTGVKLVTGFIDLGNGAVSIPLYFEKPITTVEGWLIG
jgi:hypothetical protein